PQEIARQAHADRARRPAVHGERGARHPQAVHGSARHRARSHAHRSMRLLKAILFLLSFPVWAQYPDKPVRIVVPFAAGAMGDVVSRVLAEELRPKLGQPVIVEAKPGASGNIGTAAVVQSGADGYTVLVGSTNHFGINQYLY